MSVLIAILGYVIAAGIVLWCIWLSERRRWIADNPPYFLAQIKDTGYYFIYERVEYRKRKLIYNHAILKTNFENTGIDKDSPTYWDDVRLDSLCEVHLKNLICYEVVQNCVGEKEDMMYSRFELSCHDTMDEVEAEILLQNL